MGVTFLHPTLPNTVFKRLLSDNAHKNVHISTTDGSVVLAHSSVLAAVTTKFQPLFSSSTYGIYKLNTPGITAKQWDILLELIHTGKVGPLPDGFNIQRLREVCESLDMAALVEYLQEQEREQRKEQEEQEQVPNFGMMIMGNNIAGESVTVDRGLPMMDVSSVREDRRKEDEIRSWVSESSARVTSSQNVTAAGQVPVSDADDEDNDYDTRFLYEEEDPVIIVESEGEGEVADVVLDKSVEIVEEEEVENKQCDQGDVGTSQPAPSTSNSQQHKSTYNSQQQKSAYTLLKSIKQEPGYNVTKKLIEKSKKQKESPTMNLNCPKCIHASDTIFDAAKHLQVVHKIANCYICKVCDRGFKTQASLFLHVKWQCEKNTRKKIKTSASRVTNFMKMHCEKCDFEADTVRQADLHFRKVHGDAKPYKCKTCTTAFKWEPQLFIHATRDCEKVKEEEEDKKYKPEGLRRGLRRGSIEVKEETNEGNSKKCSICNYVSNTIEAAGRHLKTFHGIKKCFSCKKCNNNFEEYRMYIIHFRNDCRKRGGSHKRKFDVMDLKCSGCNQVFSNTRKIANHLRRVHSIQKPYVCSYCGSGHRSYNFLMYHFKRKCPKAKISSKQTPPNPWTKSSSRSTKKKEPATTAPASVPKRRDSGSSQQERPKRATTTSHHSPKRGYKYIDIMDKQCHLCGLEHKYMWQAAKHLKEVHDVDRGFVCRACGSGFRSYMTLYFHAKKCDKVDPSASLGSGKGRVPSTAMSYKKKVSMAAKVTAQGRKGRYPCNSMQTECYLCNCVSESGAKAASHLRDAHKIKDCFVCRVCQKGYDNQAKLIYHYTTKCKKGKTMRKAPETATEKPENAGESSLNVSVNLGQPIKSDFILLKCPICGKSKENKEQAVSHMKFDHEQELCYTCKYCGDRFRDDQALIYHGLMKCKSKHSPAYTDKPGRYRHRKHCKYDIGQLKCHICGGESNNRKMAAMHLKEVHGKDRCWVCKYCGDGFLSSTNLSRHALVKCGRSPLKNKFSGKGSWLVKEQNRSPKKLGRPVGRPVSRPVGQPVVHKRTVGRPRKVPEVQPHPTSSRGRPMKYDYVQMKCSLCGKQSITKSGAADHMKKVHGIMSAYTCKFCSKRYTTDGGLCWHVNNACPKAPSDVISARTEGGYESSSTISSALSFSQSSDIAQLNVRSIGDVWADTDEEFQPQIAQLQGNFHSHEGKRGRGRPVLYNYMDLTCNLCGEVSTGINPAATHMREVHNKKECYACKNCGKTFTSLSVLNYHGRKQCGKVQGSRKKRTVTIGEMIQMNQQRNTSSSALEPLTDYRSEAMGGSTQQQNVDAHISEPAIEFSPDLGLNYPVKIEIDRVEGNAFMDPSASTTSDTLEDPSKSTTLAVATGLQVITSTAQSMDYGTGVDSYEQFQMNPPAPSLIDPPVQRQDRNTKFRLSFEGGEGANSNMQENSPSISSSTLMPAFDLRGSVPQAMVQPMSTSFTDPFPISSTSVSDFDNLNIIQAATTSILEGEQETVTEVETINVPSSSFDPLQGVSSSLVGSTHVKGEPEAGTSIMFDDEVDPGLGSSSQRDDIVRVKAESSLSSSQTRRMIDGKEVIETLEFVLEGEKIVIDTNMDDSDSDIIILD